MKYIESISEVFKRKAVTLRPLAFQNINARQFDDFVRVLMT